MFRNIPAASFFSDPSCWLPVHKDQIERVSSGLASSDPSADLDDMHKPLDRRDKGLCCFVVSSAKCLVALLNRSPVNASIFSPWKALQLQYAAIQEPSFLTK